MRLQAHFLGFVVFGYKKIMRVDLKDKIKLLPKNPGVYVMLGASGEVIYVDGDRFNKNAVGVTYNEVVDAVDNGGIPSNGEQYRKIRFHRMCFPEKRCYFRRSYLDRRRGVRSLSVADRCYDKRHGNEDR